MGARRGIGRLGHDLELVNALGALAQAGAQAVRSRIAAAQDHHPLALRVDILRGIQQIALAAPVLLRQKLHRKMDALQLAARNRQVARPLAAARQQHRIEVVHQRLHGQVHAHMRVGHKRHALLAHLPDAPVEQVFLQLEVGNPIAHQPADAVVLLIHRHRVAGPAQLLCGGQSRRPAAHHRNAAAAVVLGRLGQDPSLVPRAVHNAALDQLDGDGRLGDR